MLSLLSLAWSKVWHWLLAGAALIAAVLFVVARVAAYGAAKEKLDTAERALQEARRNASIAAEIKSVDAAVRRKRLRERWSRR